MDEKSLTLKRINTPVIVHFVVSILVIFSSFLSLRHFFIANFPTSIYEGSFCDISAFFNCDNSAYSFIADIFGIPLGYFGIAVGLASLMGIFFPSAAFERTNKFINFLEKLGTLYISIYLFYYMYLFFFNSFHILLSLKTFKCWLFVLLDVLHIKGNV